jgi:uncharacterized protein YndB with AHSA1/START domain
MGPISLETTIDAPRERVYDVIADLGIRPGFTDHFQLDYRLARVDSSGAGAAARFQIAPPGPGKLWAETVIAEAERPRKIVEHGRMGRLGRIPVHTAWELTEGPGVTDVRLTAWTEPGKFDRPREILGAGRWHKRQWKKALRRLAEAVEGGAVPERVEIAGGDRAWTGVF